MQNEALLVSSQRGRPWGLVLLSDADSRELVPTTMEGACAVGVGTAVVCRSIHGQEGEALAEVLLNSEPSDLQLVYDAEITVPSGTLRLGDAGDEETVSVAVDPGP
jgi:hypothetical protein